MFFIAFEDRYYFIPADYHEYLTSVYLDYIKLPLIDKQVSHHDFEAYYLE